MSRNRSHNERQIRTALRRFVLRNWRMVSALLLAWIAIIGVTAIAMNGYLAGFMHGVLVASFPFMIYLGFLLGSGQTFRVSGKWGEDNTRDSLRAARRRRRIHGWIDNLEVQGGDVDHLVFSDHGVFAIDSKWHGHALTSETLRRDQERAASSAQRARSILRAVSAPQEVTPVVVIWGGQQEHVPSGGVIRDDVLFLAGRDLKKWLRSPGLVRPGLNRSDARRILTELHSFRDRVRPS